MTPAKNKKIIMAVTVSEAKRMLKIVAKLVGLAKALTPRSFATNCGRWVPQLGSVVSPSITPSGTSPTLKASKKRVASK